MLRPVSTLPFALLALLSGCSSSSGSAPDDSGASEGGRVGGGLDGAVANGADAAAATDSSATGEGSVSPPPPSGDSGGTDTGSGEDGGVSPPVVDSGPPGVFDASAGHVLAEFPFDSGSAWARASPVANSPLATLAAKLDPQSPGTDQWAGLSRDGATIAFVTTRFNCISADCLAIADGDGSNASLVEHVAGTEIVAEGRPTVANGGNLIVYPAKADGNGNPSPHIQDLYAIRKTAAGWGLPVLLTGQMSALNPVNVYAHDIGISYDDSTVVFDCGVSNNQVPPQDTCLAKTDGSTMSILIAHDAGPGGGAKTYTHHPDYAPDGTVVFEADWTGGSDEQIWRFTPGQGGAAGTVEVIGDYDDDNSPCVLPDGRIASLWLNRPGNTASLHELKIMNADGTNPVMAVINEDIVDVGQSCGM